MLEKKSKWTKAAKKFDNINLMVNQSIRVPLNGFKPFPFGNFDVKVKARSGRSVTDDDNVIFGYDLVEKLG